MSGELRRDPLSGRTVIVAPGRARRPGAGAARVEPATAEELESCPFCEGREDRTPPEALALPERSPPDSPGWTVRVVPNLYPAFERQEVVAHSPRHARSFAELGDEEIGLAAAAWRERARAARAAGFGYVHALVNEGRAAGASLAHSHSQLVWMRERPPAVTAEANGGAAQLAAEALNTAPDRIVDVAGRLVAFCPAAGRVPYETLIANSSPPGTGAFDSDRLPVALALLRSVVRRLRNAEGPVPWNAWLHDGPDWHIEVVPRLTVLAGVELGAGIYVNTLAPEDAAAALRGAAA